MPRNMSFSLTTTQIVAREKTVTRRKGWANLKAGEMFWAVRKAMGLKPGERVERLALLRCVSNKRVRLNAITNLDVVREGFPGMTRVEFVEMFCREMGGRPDQTVQRIVFEYVGQAEVVHG